MDKCLKCNCDFENKQLLLQHIQNVHKSEYIYKCFYDNCSRSYENLSSFTAHVKRKHSFEKSFHNNQNKERTIHNNLNENETFLSNPSLQTNTQLQIYKETGSDNDEELSNINMDFVDCDTYSDDDSSDYEIPFDISSNLDQSSIDSESELENIGLNYIANLYKYNDISRTRVQSVIHDSQTVCKTLINHISNEISSLNLMESDKLFQVQELLNKSSKLFEPLDSEQKCFNRFSQLKTYVAPVSVNIGERKEVQKQGLVQISKFVPVNIQIIPLTKVLKNFFEIPSIFKETIDYVQYLMSDCEIVTNFIQGEYWRERVTHFGDKWVLPLIMYFDDFENNNPLGSHRGVAKTGAIYVNIPCLPVEYQSKLENIFIFSLFNTIDRDIFKNEVVFSRIIEEFNYLQENGITIELPEGSKQIYFELALIVGDNLGLHSILGFLESFNATVFCHICLIKRNEINKTFRESNCSIRNEDNYQSLLKCNSKISGIKEECVFHKIKNFHVTRNVGVDAMHDILEGVARYDMALILNDLIYKKKYFNLEELNYRVHSFDYGPNKHINKPVQIYESQIKNGCIIMSSSEMKCFINNFNLMVGHKIPKHDDVWSLYLSLLHIKNIVFSDNIHNNTSYYLEVLIEEYLRALDILFPNSAKPKHHHLLHYPRFMRLFGPLGKICCLRYEAKHRDGKRIASTSSSRININRTIAVRHQMAQNYRFLNKKSNCDSLLIGRKKEIPSNFLEDYDKFLEILPKFLLKRSLQITTWINFKGIFINKNAVLVFFTENNPQLFFITEIVIEKNDIFFLSKKFVDYSFDSHFNAYKIYDCTNVEHYLLKKNDIESCLVTHITVLSNGYYYIPKSWI